MYRIYRKPSAPFQGDFEFCLKNMYISEEFSSILWLISWSLPDDEGGITCMSKTLGFLRRNLGDCTMQVKSTAYTSLVRPTLEYSSSVWDPSSIQDIKKWRRFKSKLLDLCIATTTTGLQGASQKWSLILVGNHYRRGGRLMD